MSLHSFSGQPPKSHADGTLFSNSPGIRVRGEENIQKLASELRRDPNQALQLAVAVAKLSVPSPDQGSGLPKTATQQKPDADRDGWSAVIALGAA